MMSTMDIYPLHMTHLPDSIKEKSEEELNETPERKVTGLQELKEILQNDKVMKGIQFHDDFLTQFLRKNKYDTTRSLKNLQNYVLLRRKYSSKFERVTDEDLSAILPDKFYVLLPKRCPEGCAVIIVKIGNWNPTEFSFENLEKSILFLVMQILRDPMTQICGIKVIYDCKGSSFQQLRYVTPYNTYMYYHAMLNCLAGRYKGLHIINDSIVMKTMFTLMKSLMTKKLRSRVHFHSCVEDLLDFFPRSILPIEYGGELINCESEDWLINANKEQAKCTIEGQSNLY
ncbi:alpha-tocopherol transfer protein-like [Trichonephila inaurata madagascariensis]|uniref:Alpha-tocopherol transfer protein-like n=1 Tax=Trichonephila inaurata madagascariensis TaxID=2747483 RepID=A0A8X7C776_9ARAC|nr:alpha-tocopherol transfer protein-like [Trichonephila inaurata madagascariensis]